MTEREKRRHRLEQAEAELTILRETPMDTQERLAQSHALASRLLTELGESEDLERILFERSPIGIALFDLDGRILEANPAIGDMLGYVPAELIGHSFAELTHPGDLEQNGALFRELAKGLRDSFQMEKRFVRKDGEIVWGTLTASIVRGATGIPRLAVVSMVEDITARKRAELALAESRADYERLVEMSPDPIVVHQNGRIAYVNPAGTRLLKASSPQQIIGRPVLDFVHPDFHEVVKERVQRVLSEGESVSLIEERFLCLDGTTVDVEVAAGALTYQDQPAVQVIFRDITERRRARQMIETEIARRTDALHRSEAKFRAVFESAGVGIAISGPVQSFSLSGEAENLTQVNQTLLDMLGYTPEEFEQLGVMGVSHPDDFETDQALMADLMAGKMDSYRIEKRYRRKGGSWMWGLLTVSLVRDAAGNPEFALALVVDITDRKQREETLRAQMNRMSELDRLKTDFVSTVSHELRTPLTSIMGYAEFLEDQVGGTLTPEQQAYVDQIREGSHRLQRLLDDLLDFARLEAGALKLQTRPSDLGARLQETVRSLEPQIHANRLSLELSLPPEPMEVEMDAHRIGQVLLNLIGNAIKFTPAGGRIAVRACHEDGGVRVEVEDTGIGIAPPDLPMLFERFYQAEPGLTRERGGAGLGLAISKAIIEGHGGSIGAESEPGRGSTFWFTLPCHPQAGR